MLIGYARISTKDQSLELQTDALEKAGCDKIYTDTMSGAKETRPGLTELLENIQDGDTIIVWKIDRLGRSIRHLVNLVNDLAEQGVGLKSLNDPIDTTTAQGRLVLNIFASLAEFERELIIERTQAGLAAARARGRNGGRPKGLSKQSRIKAAAAATMYQQRKDKKVSEIAEDLGISRATLYRYLHIQGVIQKGT